MNNWYKLHSASILLMFTSKVKDLLIPLLLTLFAGGTGYGSRFTSLLFPILIIVILLYSFLYWVSFRYQFYEGELRIKQGIFIKKKRYIRKNRVQSVDIVSGMFHRLLKVEKVKIETAGGGMEPEVELAAVKQKEAQFIRTQLRSVDVPNQSEGEEAKELGLSTERSFYYKVPLKSIIIAGFTSGKVGLVFSAAAALISQIDQFLPRGFYENSIGVLISKGAVFLTGILLVVAFIAWIISIFITVIQYGNFEISKNDKELIISRGLLEKRHLTLQLNRITSVRYVCNPIRQWLGVWSIYVDSAGGGSKEEQLSTLLLPLGSRKEIDHLMKEVLPYAQMPETIQPLPKKAALRYIIRTSIIWWLLTFPVMCFLPNGWVFFILPLSFSYLGWLRYKDSGFTLRRNQCVLQTRLFSLSCNILPKNQIQSITYQQSFFQKKRKLYTLSADILSTTGGRTFQLNDMETDEHQNIFEWYKRNNK